MEGAIRKALANGTGIRKVAAALAVGVGTVQRVKQACAIRNALQVPVRARELTFRHVNLSGNNDDDERKNEKRPSNDLRALSHVIRRP
jgi:hypothetical protein